MPVPHGLFIYEGDLHPVEVGQEPTQLYLDSAKSPKVLITPLRRFHSAALKQF